MGRLKKIFSFSGSDRQKEAKAAPQKPKIRAFPLEKLRTPSGLVDGLDEITLPLDPIGNDQFPIDNDQFPIDNDQFSIGNDPLLIPPDSPLPESIEIEEIPFIDGETWLDASGIEGGFDSSEIEEIPFIATLQSETPSIFESGVFTVGDSGEVSFDFLFDGGKYRGELAIFSLDGMEDFEPGSEAFIAEAARRALSDSELGYIVISDRTEGAKFSDRVSWEGDFNGGEYRGLKTVTLRPGDTFGAMLVPKGTVEQVFENPSADGALRPLFSLTTANPEDGFQVGQIADATGEGNLFVFEDLRIDGKSDRDYNDIVFQVRGATGKAVDLDEVINPGRDWRDSEIGRELLAYTSSTIEEIADNPTPEVEPIPDETVGETELENPEVEPIPDEMELENPETVEEPVTPSPLSPSSEILQPALARVTEQLAQFSEKPNVVEQMQIAFGDSWNPETGKALIAQLSQGEALPALESVPLAELGVKGAFSEQSNIIYLANEFLAANANNPDVLAEVLLEEIGHYLDAQLNETDSPGDEGAIFAALVKGESLAETELEAFQSENDQTTITLAGQELAIERNSGTGLLGKYYDTPFFNQPKLTRTDAKVDFNWGSGAPDPSMEADSFTARWMGQIEPIYNEPYTFHVHADEFTRLWINGQLVIDGWIYGSNKSSQPITLQAGQKYDIQFEYKENSNTSNVRLLWSSPSQTTEVIPTSALYPKDLRATNVQGQGTGLLGTYYDTTFFSQPKLTRTDAELDFDWGSGAPDPSMGADSFTARWTGQIEPIYNEPYTFHVHADEFTRLWINGQLVIDGWIYGSNKSSQPITLQAGQKYDIQFEYKENSNTSNVRLLWSSPSQTTEVIPTSALYPKDLRATNVQGQGTGLLGTYYDTTFFSQPKLTRTDAELDFDWGSGAPDPSMGADSFTARWTGQIEPIYNEPYTFHVHADEFTRLWINGQLVIDGWIYGSNKSSQPITLQAGQKYDIQFEYKENSNTSNVRLLWSSPSQTTEVIPTSALYPQDLRATNVQGQGTGLLGKYYDTTFFSQPKLTRTDAELDFDWGTGAPDPSMGADSFTARWMGQIEPLYDDPYTFHVHADEFTRLWIDGQLVIDGWTYGSNKTSQPITLQAGRKYDIQFEYKENQNTSNVRLLWSSPKQTLEVIPTSALYPKDLRAAKVQGQGNGLFAEYFDNADFTNMSLFRTDAAVDFDWGSGAPDPSMGADSFTARWTGQIEPIYNEPYTFHTHTDEFTRLWINGQLVIDGWTYGSNKTSQPITLQAGQKYDIQFEYKENLNASNVRLLWSSPSQTLETIPTSALYSPTPETSTTVTRQVLVPETSGNYTFDVPANTQIWINGILVINGFLGERQKNIYLQAGQSYTIERRTLLSGGWGGGVYWGSGGGGSSYYYGSGGGWGWGGLSYGSGSGDSGYPEPTDPCDCSCSGDDEGSGEMPDMPQAEDTEVVFPAAAKLFGGQHTGDGFQIPFQAPDCGTLDLTVEVDGPLADYMKALDGSLGLVNGTYTASDGGMLNLGARLKAFNEMSFEGGVAYSQLEKDRLYGTKLKLTGVYTYPDGSTETRKQEIYLYRWLEVVAGQDASVATGRTAAFHEKAEGSLGKFVPSKEVDLRLPVSVATKFQGEKSEFVYGGELTGNRTAQWDFGDSADNQKEDNLKVEVNGKEIGTLTALVNPPKAVWTGEIEPLESETYTFETHAEARLWVNGVPLAESGTPQSSTKQINLETGQIYNIRVDYYGGPGGSLPDWGTGYDLIASWSSPESPGQTRVISQTPSLPAEPDEIRSLLSVRPAASRQDDSAQRETYNQSAVLAPWLDNDPNTPSDLPSNPSNNIVGSNKALVLSPFYDQRGFSPEVDESEEIRDTLERLGFDVTYKNQGITLEDFKNLHQYGVIAFVSHGARVENQVATRVPQTLPNIKTDPTTFLNTDPGKGRVVLFTGVVAPNGIRDFEITRTPNGTNVKGIYYDLMVAGVVAPVTLGQQDDNKIYVGITPSFITEYSDSFPNSLIYAGACDSLYNHTLANAFLSQQAGAFVGFSRVVGSNFAGLHGQAMFEALAANRTTGEIPGIFDWDRENIPDSDDAKEPWRNGAIFTLASGSTPDLTLKLED